MRDAETGYPKPIHDFRHSDKYPSQTRDLNHFWAWEFLRRNDTFQKLADDPKKKETYSFYDPFPEWSQDWHYRDDHSFSDIDVFPADRALQFPWKLLGPLEGPDITQIVDPFTGTTVDNNPTCPSSSYAAENLKVAREYEQAIDDRLLIVAFDVGASITGQIEQFREIFNEAQEKLNNSRIINFEEASPKSLRTTGMDLLIRLLDAMAVKASNAQIITEFQLDPKDLSSRRRRALALASKDYRRLPTRV